MGKRAGSPRRIPILRLLPNLMSILALCAGLTAIRATIDGKINLAVVLICIAAALDGMDGRLARILKSESDIGAELDSLCDIINFGVTPAFVLFYWGMAENGSLGWIAVLSYTVCCMLRLARFNVDNRKPEEPQNTENKSPADFVGVPSPAGALLALAPIYLTYAFELKEPAPSWITALWMFFIGILMISRLPTPSFKAISIRTEVARFVLLGSAALIAALLTYPWATLLICCLTYFCAIFITWRKRKSSLRNIV